MADQKWRLPAGVDEWLPPAAWRLEEIRRRVLDVLHSWGYQYIEPPIIEYLDGLLVGGGEDLDLQTLKVVDQRSGRLLGVRADMTAQAVRVDAHSLPRDGVQRLCYAGNIVFANPASPVDTRVPLKAGAELFGADSLAADAEIVTLMLEVLGAVGIRDPLLVLGHMGIYGSLTEQLDLSAAERAALFEAVQSKAEADIRALLPAGELATCLATLPTLMGRGAVLEEARRCLGRISSAALAALDDLSALADMIRARCPDLTLRFDLAELVGYGYHNGPVFSAYHADLGRALARGGRYDGIGAEFGRSRPATGFDVSLKELAADAVPVRAVWAPWPEAADQAALVEAVAALRSRGEVVIAALSAADEPPANCDRVLTREADGWFARPLDG